MRRKVTRMRQEFLERKQHESVHEAIYNRKRQLRDALASGTALPSHLTRDAVKLKRFVELDDERTKEQRPSVDDEYALTGGEDPRILITTSRDPSQKLMEFTKEMRLMFCGAVRVNRGSTPIGQLFDVARRENYSDVVVVSESKGVPDRIAISHLPLGPTAVFSVHNLVTRHEIPDVGPVSEQAPHLMFENFSTPLGARIASVLKHLFPIPREDGTRVLVFDNANDFISFRHYTFEKIPGKKDPLLTEVGPRFELFPFRITLGTMEMDDADIEWIYHPYVNSAKRRRLL